MSIKEVVRHLRPAWGAALLVGALVAGTVAANGHEVTVGYGVSAQGLDLSKPAGARALYSRVKHAAEVVCTHGRRVDLQPVADGKGCYEKALSDAVRSFNLPLLTQVYLASHTSPQAAARGIEVPVEVAAK